MEVKREYKQTEVGVIPKDWEILELTGTARVVDSLHQTPIFSEDGYPMVRVADIKTGNLSLDGALMVSETVFAEFTRNYKPKKGDIVLSRVGSYGVSSFVETNEPFCLGQNTVVLQPKLPARFLYYSLNSYSIRQQIENGSYGSGYKSLSLKKIKELLISFPPTKAEQEAIAAALSDADALVNNLEKVIAKKRAIKQGAMQLLLTGKKRLSGFSGGWITKALGEIGKISGAGVDKKIKPDEITVRLVNYMDVYNKNYIYSKNLSSYSSASPFKAKRCAVKKGDIFFTPSSEMPYDIGLSSVAMEDIPDATYSYHVVRLRLLENWDLTFRTYIFKTTYFLKQAETFCEGSGQRYFITLKKFKELRIHYPADIEEQTAIAQVLSDMDAEIEELEHKFAKYKMIKQAIMQELLTGKKRLI